MVAIPSSLNRSFGDLPLRREGDYELGRTRDYCPWVGRSPLRVSTRCRLIVDYHQFWWILGGSRLAFWIGRFSWRAGPLPLGV